jgi:hypothetical protein
MCGLPECPCRIPVGRGKSHTEAFMFVPHLGRACAFLSVALLEALGETRSWQLTGDTLVLTGEAGQVVRFAAQYMR